MAILRRGAAAVPAVVPPRSRSGGVKVAKDDAPRAYFDTDPVITGYSLPANESTIHAVVTVTFPDGTDMGYASVVEDDPEDRFDIQTDTQGNTIVVEVYGRKATEADGNGEPDVDAKLHAQIGGNKIGETNVVIVIPAKIKSPAINGNVMPQNRLLYQGSSPAAWVVSGTYGLQTWWLHELNMDVLDQFGNPINPIYQGQMVYEYSTKAGKYIKINQKIQSGGYYIDPVGVGRALTDIKYVTIPDPKISSWPTDPPEQRDFNIVDFPADNKIQISGHEFELDGRIVKPSEPTPQQHAQSINIEITQAESK